MMDNIDPSLPAAPPPIPLRTRLTDHHPPGCQPSSSIGPLGDGGPADSLLSLGTDPDVRLPLSQILQAAHELSSGTSKRHRSRRTSSTSRGSADSQSSSRESPGNRELAQFSDAAQDLDDEVVSSPSKTAAAEHDPSQSGASLERSGDRKRQRTNTNLSRAPPAKPNGPIDDSDPNHTQSTVDPLQLAHALIHSQPGSHLASAHSSLLTGTGGASSASEIPLSDLINDHLSSADQELVKKIGIIINPLKLEIDSLRLRVKALEDERLIATREINILKERLRASAQSNGLTLARSVGKDSTNNSYSKAHSTPSNSKITATVSLQAGNPLDIPVGPLPNPFGTIPAGSAVPQSTRLPTAPALISNTPDAVAELATSRALSTPFTTPYDLEEPFRRQGYRRKSELSPGAPLSSSANSAANRAKHRKPELSRTVRATVFKLMGVSSSNSPATHNVSLPNESRFGSEKIRAYHGYTTTPCFPDYTPDELFDPETGAKLWRWDWSKTIRQSQNNTSFAKEIRNVIVKEAADPIRPMHTEVPASDWQFLDDAIDSAYTNMRRERDNLIDPNKMVKKEVHRARNKKRGLKEDKYKRRKKALDEYRADPKNFASRLKEMDLELGKQPVASEADLKNFALEGESYNWEDSLEIKYMSSEDEANVNDFDNPISVGTERADSSLAVSDKVFAICRPAWRSQQLQNFYSVLDTIKQPERAYRRVMGSTRQSRPPLGTPSWMVRSDWAATVLAEGEQQLDHPNKDT